LMPAFVVTQDGAEKQDCERDAVKRWFAEHGARLAPLRPIFLGDDLFACELDDILCASKRSASPTWTTPSSTKAVVCNPAQPQLHHFTKSPPHPQARMLARHPREIARFLSDGTPNEKPKAKKSCRATPIRGEPVTARTALAQTARTFPPIGKKQKQKLLGRTLKSNLTPHIKSYRRCGPKLIGPFC
jgi:hypothetical protein